MRGIRNYATGAMAAAFFMALGSLLSRNSVSAAATKSTAPARGYYLTATLWDGANPLNACAAGYHMASLTELHDTSSLRYDTSLGFTTTDSGGGAPVGQGWIRTGFNNWHLDTPIGRMNCDTWSTSSVAAYGTLANFYFEWPNATNWSPWFLSYNLCSASERVWCIQD